MAKVTEYSRITKMKDNDVLLVDGPDGTRTILQTDASKQMGGEVIMVNETAGDSTKVVINTTDEDIELATMADLEPVEEDVSELKTQIISDQVVSINYSTPSLWELGNINNSTGGNSSSTARIRTVGTIPNDVSEIKANSGFFGLLGYDGNTYKGAWTSNEIFEVGHAADLLTGTFDIETLKETYPTYTFRIVWGKSSHTPDPATDYAQVDILKPSEVSEAMKAIRDDITENATAITVLNTKVDSDLFLQGYDTIITTGNYQTALADLDNALVNRIYRINGALQNIAHIPTNESATSATLITYAAKTYTNKSWYVQLLTCRGNTTYYRSCWAGAWSEWEAVIKQSTITDINTTINNISDIINKGDNEIHNYYMGSCVNKKEITLQEGDSIIAFGDSITHGSSGVTPWIDVFASITGTTAINKAVSGALFGHSSTDRPQQYWISTQIDATTEAQWNAAKLIFVAAGTNDVGYDIPVSETAQYVQDAIDDIKTNAPNVPIVLITPIRRSARNSAANLKLPELSGIIANIALKNECNVICGFDFPIPTTDIGDNIVNFTLDGLHPNQYGANVYAKCVISELM